MNCYFKIIGFLILFSNSKNLFGQVSILDSNILSKNIAQCAGKVVYEDSVYYLVPSIILNSETTIKVPKKLLFNDGTIRYNIKNAGILLSKLILSANVLFSVDKGLTQTNLEDDHFKFTDFTKHSKLDVKINLNDIYPLEKGYYTLLFYIDVKYKKRSYKILSEPISFWVDKNPPQSAVYHEW